MTDRISPNLALADPAAPLAQEDVGRWREAGYTFVRGLLEPELVAALRESADAHFPAAGHAEAGQFVSFGSNLTFPAECAAFNDVTLAPPLLAATAQLLDVTTTALRLTQSDLWPKYGRSEKLGGKLDNQDQRIHVDYPNHTLVHPSPWSKPDAVELILYLDEGSVTGGGTAVVPREGSEDPLYPWPIVDSPGIGDLDYINDRTSAEEYMRANRPAASALREALYAREIHADFRPGDILFYRHDTWHRGTPMVPGQRRLVHNMTFRKADAEWINTLHVGWSWKAYRKNKYMEKLISRLSVEQRTVLGFPGLESPYWCDETLAAVEARYGCFGFDIRPYAEALAVDNLTREST